MLFIIVMGILAVMLACWLFPPIYWLVKLTVSIAGWALIAWLILRPINKKISYKRIFKICMIIEVIIIIADFLRFIL